MLQDTIRPWIEATRPKTLPAAVIPVLVGTALAYEVGVVHWIPVLACLLFALLVQIGANFANDYADFEKGADTAARLGPRRAVASGAISVGAMRRGTFVVLALAFACGMILVWWRGWELLPVGLLSLLFAWAYTGGPYPLAYHGLGDVFVFVFFGLVAVCGTYYVLVGKVTLFVLDAAVPVGLLATNILVVNNCRDIVTDERAGKHTLVVRYGRQFGRRQYGIVLAVAAAVPIIVGVYQERYWLAAASVVLLAGIPLWRTLCATRDGDVLNGVLARTAGLLFVFGVVWAGLLAFAPG
jgi:1,4-dihydroxy-2-naphthoate octaprenyltransferase